MPIRVDIRVNKFPQIAAALPSAAERVAAHAAQTLRDRAYENSPVSDRDDHERDGLPHMRDTLKVERTGEARFEVSIQKDQALAGEKTWSWFNDAGTVHYAGSHFFTDACADAAKDLEDAALFDKII